MSKTKYRIRNWKDYNRSLIQRGSITVWFSPDAIDKWLAVPTKKRGRPSTYSDDAILTALLIRFIKFILSLSKMLQKRLSEHMAMVPMIEAIVIELIIIMERLP
ncbi:MAG TPA: transposase [Candidatus Babeliaceae bacterium]|nr:transposase [Candidatus Babeliaceae bacterium]